MAFLLMNLAATAQSTGVHIGGSVFGGGNEATVGRGTTVLIDQADAEIAGDVYGGGALAQVDVTRNSANPPDATSDDYISVTILQGHVEGNVYGGGLGDSIIYGGSANVAAHVYGPVFVSIGNNSGGSASFGNNSMVFGGNNLNGTPKDNISVDIWQTAHGTTPQLNLCPSDSYLMALAAPTDELTPADIEANTDQTYALKAVYGGGNKASYMPLANKSATVVIHGCSNTIEDVYGGGNAANVGTSTVSANTDLTIEGGRIYRVFGGGNGYSATGNHTDPTQPNYNPGANIYGTATTTIQGGLINEVFGGSNNYGDITTVNLTLEDSNSCSEVLVSLFGGANESVINSNVTLSISCPAGAFKEVYGGSNKANINGDVTLNIYGGTIDEAYGGSKGTNLTSADITGNVELNLYGGEIGNAFGGSNINGNITGSITVNVEANQEHCGLSITNVYGAGNETAYRPTDSTIVYPEVNVIKGTITGNVFGGGKGDSATVTANPKVTVSGGSIGGNVYGGNVYGGGEQARTVGNTEVNVISGTISGNVFGGGLGSTAIVTANPKVTVSGGSIGGSVYGGGEQASTTGSTKVNVTAGTVDTDVFGGGKEASVSGNVEVNVSGGTITRDVYGGGALADVNTNGSNTTTVNILGGTLRDVYGGGLGQKNGVNGATTDIEAIVNGVVTVNIGATDGASTPTYSGSATYIRTVYGCNNVNGSPKDDVYVNIYQTAHNTTNTYNYEPTPEAPATYAIDQVFGGGNAANYEPNGNDSITVTLHGCENTVRRVFGGGNAADATTTPSTGTVVTTTIWGGRFDYVFGGGNGEGEGNAANLTGDVVLAIHGGRVEHYFGGSNQSGTIYGSTNLIVDSDGPCPGEFPTHIEEFFCGGNFANIVGDVVTTIACDETMANVHIVTLYGGCNQADITGNVELTVNGGNYDYIYGGSKGSESQSADISGDVTLNIYGGTIRDAVFGGCNVNGTIGGKIIVNVEDKGGYCPLSMENADVFGGGNLATYTAPTATPDYPEVNIINATVKNVFGGGNGDPNDAYQTKGSVTGNPRVYINKVATPETYRGVVMGNVYGGGNAAMVDGNPTIELWRRAKVFGNVYGGGNEGKVTGDTKVIVNGDVVTP